MRRRDDPSDLTDAEGKILVPVIPPALEGGRPRTIERRTVPGAMCSLDRTGLPLAGVAARCFPVVHRPDVLANLAP